MNKGGGKPRTKGKNPARGRAVERSRRSQRKIILRVRRIDNELPGKSKKHKPRTAKALVKIRNTNAALVEEEIRREEDRAKDSKISSVNLISAEAEDRDAKPAKKSESGDFKRFFSRLKSADRKEAGRGGIPNAASPATTDPRQQEKEERAKRFMMWSGVIFFMLLISFGWLYSTKQTFERTKVKDNGNFSLSDWNDMAADLNEKMNQMKVELNDIQTFASQNKGPEIQPGSSSTESEIFMDGTGSNITDDEIDDLKEKIEDLTNNENGAQPTNKQ